MDAMLQFLNVKCIMFLKSFKHNAKSEISFYGIDLSKFSSIVNEIKKPIKWIMPFVQLLFGFSEKKNIYSSKCKAIKNILN